MNTLQEIYQAYLQSSGVATDTRQIKESSIFFALKGDNFNGNTYAAQAIEKGAAYVVVDDPAYAQSNCFLVEDVLSCLQQLAKHHRENLTIPFLGLTGSNGKTTTKELIAQVLGSKYNVAFTQGNLNNHIGVPLTLLAIRKEHDIAIIEMGANHKKEIEFLCKICQPNYGYITNFGKAHLEGFGGFEGVIAGKTELYHFLKKTMGHVFINASDPLQLEHGIGIEQITFSTDTRPGDFTITQQEESKATSTLSVRFEKNTIHSQLTGQYNLSNMAAAIAIGSYFKVPVKQIKHSLETYVPENNRSQIAKTKQNELIIDAYNANPSSMEQALLNFEQFPATAKWCILGDMFELGQYECEEHLKIVQQADSMNFEQVILVGKAFYQCENKGISFEKTQDLLDFLSSNQPINKTILLKGSRGMRLEKAIPLL